MTAKFTQKKRDFSKVERYLQASLKSVDKTQYKGLASIPVYVIDDADPDGAYISS